MTSPHHAATLAAMREAGCVRDTFWVDVYDNPRQVARCNPHVCWWDDARDACPVIDAAVAIGYSAGRRDALTEAVRHAQAAAIHYEPPLDTAWRNAASSIRSLIDNEETKP